ncbi:unnamed protein product [Pedinophyceae sp. YPF-701]|nr:unnamed protein product [Pedinophyceae sp. YPF-701]
MTVLWGLAAGHAAPAVGRCTRSGARTCSYVSCHPPAARNGFVRRRIRANERPGRPTCQPPPRRACRAVSAAAGGHHAAERYFNTRVGPIVVRRLRRERVDEATALLERAFNGFGTISESEMRDIFEELCSEDGTGVALAADRADDDEMVGVVCLYLDERHVFPLQDAAYLSNMGVAPECRRAGVASRLLRAVEDYAAAAGRERLFLHAYNEDAPALGLYSAAGFHLVVREVADGHKPRPKTLMMKHLRHRDSASEGGARDGVAGGVTPRVVHVPGQPGLRVSLGATGVRATAGASEAGGGGGARRPAADPAWAERLAKLKFRQPLDGGGHITFGFDEEGNLRWD